MIDEKRWWEGLWRRVLGSLFSRKQQFAVECELETRYAVVTLQEAVGNDETFARHLEPLAVEHPC